MTHAAQAGRSPLSGGAPVRVKLRVWGVTDTEIEHAIRRAGIGAGQVNWKPDIHRLSAVPCPLALDDPAAIAAESGPGWAYVAYPEGHVDA